MRKRAGRGAKTAPGGNAAPIPAGVADSQPREEAILGAMNARKKAAEIGAILDELLGTPEIPLRHDSPYTLLCATILSAQCRDDRVNEITPKLFARARDPRAMAALGEARIRGIVRPCGLAPAKAKALAEGARILVERHGGEVPRTFEELEALPGVGHKTASVVMCHAFGVPAFPVDTHVHRLAARWGLSDGSSVERTERDLKRLWPPEEWEKRHLQIIAFGRKFCPARGHDPAACPVCSRFGKRERPAAKAPAGKAKAGKGK